MNATLYEKIGGKEIVKKTSHHLYVNILKDELLNPFFENVDVKVQELEMNAFLTYVFGGNSLYILARPCVARIQKQWRPV